MSDNFNNRSEINGNEAARRAERISAIKKSIRETSGAVKLEERPADAPLSKHTVDSGADEWEAGLAERIVRHSNAKKARELSVESILSELDNHDSKILEENTAPIVEPDNQKYTSVENIETQEVLAEASEAPNEAEAPKSEEPIAEELSESNEPAKKKKKKKRSLKDRFFGLFPQKGDSIWERIRKLVYLGAVAVIIVCSYMIGDYYIDLMRSERENDKYMGNYWDHLSNEPATQPSTEADEKVKDDRKVYSLLEGAEYFLNINKDVVGVIRIPDTPVNNPVMQCDDNKKYLNVKMNGRESRAGEIFLDYRNSFDKVDSDGHLSEPNSDNLIIYGHNMKDEQMFGCLKSYERDSSFYEKHPIIELNSNYERYKYKIFSVFLLDAEDESETEFDCWNEINFNSEDEFYEFVNEAKRRTIRLNDVDVKYGDKLVTLSTCNTLLGDRGRLIVMGRLVREGEDPMAGTQNSTANPNIKWPSLFYTYRPSAKKYDPDAEFIPYEETAASKTVSGE